VMLSLLVSNRILDVTVAVIRGMDASMYVCMFVCMYVCTYVYMCLYDHYSLLVGEGSQAIDEGQHR